MNERDPCDGSSQWFPGYLWAIQTGHELRSLANKATDTFCSTMFPDRLRLPYGGHIIGSDISSSSAEDASSRAESFPNPFWYNCCVVFPEHLTGHKHTLVPVDWTRLSTPPLTKHSKDILWPFVSLFPVRHFILESLQSGKHPLHCRHAWKEAKTVRCFQRPCSIITNNVLVEESSPWRWSTHSSNKKLHKRLSGISADLFFLFLAQFVPTFSLLLALLWSIILSPFSSVWSNALSPFSSVQSTHSLLLAQYSPTLSLFF